MGYTWSTIMRPVVRFKAYLNHSAGFIREVLVHITAAATRLSPASSSPTGYSLRALGVGW
jgi:hypothetical protein